MNCMTRSCSPSLVVVTLLGIILSLLPLGVQGFAQSEEDHRAWHGALDNLSSERMLADVTTLSSSSFNGRQTGTADDANSAKWIADQFLASGLSLASTRVDPSSPMGPGRGYGTGLMTAVVTVPKIAPDPLLRISTASDSLTHQLGTDYLPILDSPSAEVRGPIVFVGYGIVDATQGIDDYAGVETTNAVVLFLRGKPTHYKGAINHADKVRLARQKGAQGYLTATGPVLSSYEARRGVTGEPSAFYGLSLPSETLPGAWISTTLAEQILAAPEDAQPSRLHKLQEKLNQSPAAQSVNTGRYSSLDWQTCSEEGVLMNVLAFLPGNNPQKTHEFLVIGAHRDHFGRQAGLLFPGADDNASGTAVMLEVARVMAKAGAKSKRTILFVSFSGEEQGLVGSRLYLERPVAPVSSTKAMINIDHASIGNGRLTVGVTGLEKNVVLDAGQAAGLADKLDVYGFFPGGDHVPFKEAGIPTITIVSGGVHSHFHQPTDSADTINPEILQTVARYVLALAWQLANVQ
ncbi:MAG: M20/M25/M40 family metallo-hydrolase [Nitrospiraceae bacterium]|nr:M20/M25/M40 family metallo-hydrolase [Nitrospiraceae bacterium]